MCDKCEKVNKASMAACTAVLNEVVGREDVTPDRLVDHEEKAMVMAGLTRATTAMARVLGLRPEALGMAFQEALAEEFPEIRAVFDAAMRQAKGSHAMMDEEQDGIGFLAKRTLH